MADLTWDSVVSTALSIALVLVPIYLAYLLNERSKQKEFERKERYDRKLRAYEGALSGIRRIWDAASIGGLLRAKGQMAPAIAAVLATKKPEDDQAARDRAAQAIETAFLAVTGTIFAFSKFADELPQELAEHVDDQAAAEKLLERLTNQTTLLTMRVTLRAEEDI